MTALVPKQKAATREGRLCRHDNTTVKYVSSGNCVACSIRQWDNRAKKAIAEKERLHQEQLDLLPSIDIRVERKARMTIVYRIPRPPRHFSTARWL